MKIISNSMPNNTRQNQVKSLLVTVMITICLSATPFQLVANTPESTDVEKIEILQAELKLLQENMVSIQAKLNEVSVVTETVASTEAVTEPKQKSVVKGYLSAKNWDAQLGGELEFEYLDAEGDGVNSRFKIDQLYLYPTAKYGDNLELSADIAVYTNNALIEEAWARYSGLPGNSWIEVGLNDMLMANVPRKTEAEILIETAFYRDDDMGVRFGGSPNDSFYWSASISNGLKLATKAPGEIDTFRIIHDDRQTSSANDKLQMSVAAGFKRDFGAVGSFDIMPFYVDGSLSEADVSFLQGIAGYGLSNDTNKTRKGFNFLWKNRNFSLLGQSISGEDGTLERSGWFVQPSYKFDYNGQNKLLKDFELIYRYNDLEVDLANNPLDSLTWDRQQHIFGLGLGVFDSVKLKLEYSVNDEDTGDTDVDNNELLLQVELKY